MEVDYSGWKKTDRKNKDYSSTPFLLLSFSLFTHTVGCALTLERRMRISCVLYGKYILKTELKCKQSNLLHPLANLSKKDLK